MRFRPGELDQQVDLQKEIRTPDSMGGATSVWTTQATVWAHVRPLRGSERAQADRIEAQGGFLVVVRYRQDVNEAWRILWNGRAMNIRFIQDNGKRSAYLPIECESGVAT